MDAEKLAKLIAERVISYADYIECVVPTGCLGTLIASAIRDLNLIQAEPIPEGAVPVVVYVGVDARETPHWVKSCACDGGNGDGEYAASVAFASIDTHRVCLEGYALPVAVPTVKAKSVET